MKFDSVQWPYHFPKADDGPAPVFSLERTIQPLAPLRHSCQGTKFHSSACVYEWILKRTSDFSQSARPTGRVLKSAGETSIL